MNGCLVGAETGDAQLLKENFDLRVSEVGRLALVRVSGAIDGENATAFYTRLRPVTERCQRIVVDLRRVEFVDSPGVRALLALKEHVERRQGELRLVWLPESRVARTLSLLRLEEHFNVYTSVQRAWIDRRHGADNPALRFVPNAAR